VRPLLLRARGRRITALAEQVRLRDEGRALMLEQDRLGA